MRLQLEFWQFLSLLLPKSESNKENYSKRSRLGAFLKIAQLFCLLGIGMKFKRFERCSKCNYLTPLKVGAEKYGNSMWG